MTVADDILAYLASAGRPVKAAEIVAALPETPKGSVYSTLKDLADSGQIDRAGYGHYAMPETVPGTGKRQWAPDPAPYEPGDILSVSLGNGTVVRVKLVVVQDGPPMVGAAQAGDVN